VNNGWLTFRGNVEQCNSVWTAGPDAILEHDSSLALSPSATHYRWIVGAYYNPDNARLTIRGTSGHRAIIRNAASSGTFYGFTYNDAWGGQGSGQFDFEYVTISGCGGSTNCTDGNSHTSGIASLMRCDHCIVTSSGTLKVKATGGSSGGPLNVAQITNSTVTNTTSGGQSIRIDFSGTTTALLDTIFTDGQIALAGTNGNNATGTSIHNIIMLAQSLNDPMTLGGAHFRVGTFDLVARITPVTGNGSTSRFAYIPGGYLTRLVGLISSTYAHQFEGPVGDGTNANTVDGVYFENTGTGTNGHSLIGGGYGPLTTIKNGVWACSTQTGYGTSLSSNAIGPTGSAETIVLQNNTYCGRDDGSGVARGFGYESSNGNSTDTPQAGFLASARNNIVWSPVSAAAYLVHKGPTGAVGVGDFTNVDYNWKWNVSSGPYLGAPSTEYSPNPPGAHDSSGDPRFVQQRHFLDWGQMLKPTISTWSDIVAEFAKMNDDTGFDTRFTIANAYNWLRDGYRPQNPAVMTAGDTGGRVGAMDAYGTPSLVVGPAKIAGPGAIK
jgi:hypothetical protein